MAKKPKTNRQLFLQLIDEASDVELALIRERLWSAADEVVKNKEEVSEQMKNSIIHPSLYIGAMELVIQVIGYHDN
jgi:hypothetical protein